MTSLQNLFNIILAFIQTHLWTIVIILVVLGLAGLLFKIGLTLLKWLLIIFIGLWLGLTVLNWLLGLFV